MAIIDLTSQRFGKLIVIGQKGFNKWRNVLWLCHCDCGNTSIVSSGGLRGGKVKSCGCGHFGRTHTEEVKAKISIKTKERWVNPEFKKLVAEKIGKTAKEVWERPGYKEKMSIIAKKRCENPEVIKLMSKNSKEKWQNPEYRKHQSEIHKGRMAGEKHPMYGRKHSEETRKKLSESHQGPRPWRKGWAPSEETRKRMSESHKGIPLSEKHKNSITKANINSWNKLSDEQKAIRHDKMWKPFNGGTPMKGKKHTAGSQTEK